MHCTYEKSYTSKTLETTLFHHTPLVKNMVSLVLKVYDPLKHQWVGGCQPS
jgi:hypothetical protein